MEYLGISIYDNINKAYYFMLAHFKLLYPTQLYVEKFLKDNNKGLI